MKKAYLALLSLGLVFAVGTTTIVLASANYKPEEKAAGNVADTIIPDQKGEGEKADVLVPTVQENQDNNEQKPFEPFVPEINDPDKFVDIDQELDFSTQYDYTNAQVQSKIGLCTVEGTAYTASTASTIYANFDESTPFPYGTISAKIKNNGGDTGLVFGMSSNIPSFWEGAGVSYYFAFLNMDGLVYLGKTDNGTWSALGTASLANFSSQATYELTVLYRGGNILILVDDVVYVNVRDADPLPGTAWGFRTGTPGAVVSDLAVSSSVLLK